MINEFSPNGKHEHHHEDLIVPQEIIDLAEEVGARASATLEPEPVPDKPALSPEHDALIKESAISPEVAKARGYWTATTKASLKDLGFSPTQCRVPALVIPIYDVTGGIAFHLIRPDDPRAGKDGKPVKYDMPPLVKMALDVPPAARPHLGNPNRPLFVTEGVRKADSAVSHGLCCVDALGVWSWRGKNEEEGLVALAAWESIALNGRPVYIVFDSDVMTKGGVYAALVRLTALLKSRGALVKVIYLDPRTDGGKMGLDDFFAAGGVVATLMANATDTLKKAPNQKPDIPYLETPGGLIWRKPTPDGPMNMPLTNFTARIVSDVVEDDGVETRRSFEIEAIQGERHATLTVPAERFFGMTWTAEALGARGILAPGPNTRDHARAAIQILSQESVQTRSVFAHTGWRKIGGGWIYLHAGGALGAEGNRTDIDVSLPPNLALYELPQPLAEEALKEGIRKSLRILDVAPREVTTPLYAAPWRAILGDSDLSLFAHGKTGVGKSELAALVLQHFGAGLNARRLPGSWSSTGNSLEGLAFTAKDALFVIDDFCPTGSTADVQRMHREADRILRAQGNLAGRQRMRADTTLRPARPPRGLILSTGEDIPRGQSLRVRLFCVQVEKDSVNWDKISQCQKEAGGGIYAGVLAAYIQWMAPRYEEIRANLKGEMESLRDEVGQEGSHKRIASNSASLLLGFRYFLNFAQESEALRFEEIDAMWTDAKQTFEILEIDQREQQIDSDPATRFLRLIAGALASKRAYLTDKKGEQPDNATTWGWEETYSGSGEQQHLQTKTRGEKIGWIEKEDVYLQDDVSFAVAQKLAHEQQDSLTITKNSLHRRLKEAGKLIIDPTQKRTTLTTRRTFEGKEHRVMHLRENCFFPEGLSIDKKHDEHDGSLDGKHNGAASQ